MHSAGVDAVIVNGIKKCSELIFSFSDEGFGMVIIDTYRVVDLLPLNWLR
jgi:hypothetical protein